MSPVRRAVIVCLALASSLATAFVSRAAGGSEGSMERTPSTLIQTKIEIDATTRPRHDDRPVVRDGVLAYAPARGEHTPVVYLHGAHGRAENGCPWFRNGASELGWLVCPQGIERESQGVASWGTDVVAQGAVVTRALRAIHADAPGVAVGFSQGGYVALDLVKTRSARFRGLVLIAAPEAHPSAAKLHDAGVERVVLAAGSHDAAYATLVADANRLASEGMETRFVDLGHVGHTYAAEDPEILRSAITWAGGSEVL